MLGVNRVSVSTANPAAAYDFVAKTGASFPVGFDLSESYGPLRASASGSSSNSLHIIIDRAGNVAYLSRSYDEEAMIAVLDSLVE